MAILVFVDDHPLYRMGFELALARALPSLRLAVCASAAEGLEALEASADVDLCLSDYRLPERDGLSFLEEVGRRWPTVARGILAAEAVPALAARGRAMGLVAVLSKSRDMDSLAHAVSCLFDGGDVFDSDASVPGMRLSDRRRDLLEMAARGCTNKEIAHRLRISERTVKEHWAGVFSQLGVANRAEAVSHAHRLGLIS